MEDEKNVVERDHRDFSGDEARTVTITLSEYRELIETRVDHSHCWRDRYDRDQTISRLKEENQKLEKEIQNLRDKIRNFAEV